MEVGFKTDKGKRRNNNEDACFVLLKEKVFILADGVGGNNSGEIASRTAVNEVAKYVESHSLEDVTTPKAIREYFENCINEANFRVLELSQKFEQNKGMATTLVVGYLYNQQIYVFNIGDSRAYLFKNKLLTQITVDHSYVNTLLKAGIITEEEAENHENKNMITRAIGADAAVEIDSFQLNVDKDDIILMCTDGLHGEVTEDEIVDILSRDQVMGDSCSDLIDKANENGGNDNITIIVFRIMEEDIYE